MLRLASLLYSLISTTLAGTGVVLALVAGADGPAVLLGAAAAGAVAALPVAWFLAKRLYGA
ncbi:hypothetical protein [Mangrovicoccus sp. HB161399]|uniref:hypothetical protein n=1 Tax=Mangrovicoccus sp. HB161399 TaxID=2720392 RepID=UPI001551A38E|nr:hypothetical protein [Mangrovicoccus sp. HB161399]